MKRIDSEHPVIRQEYAVFTPPMDRLISTIGDWIDQRICGGYIYGPSRFGKSRSIRWHLEAALSERFERAVPLIKWIRLDSTYTESEFWNELLNASDYEFSNQIKPKSKVVARFLFMQRLQTLAQFSESNFVVLLIDEAHEVTLKEWKWLLGLQNSLDDNGVRLSVISIGSHGLFFQPNYLSRTGNSHIAARFFSRDLKFHGLASVEELEYVLVGYDTDSEWPEGSRISYLQHFSPEAFSRGHRLASCSQIIWKAFEELLPRELKTNQKYRLEIPMEHLTRAIEEVLTRLGNGGGWEVTTDYSEWLKMISKTGYTNYMANITTSG